MPTCLDLAGPELEGLVGHGMQGVLQNRDRVPQRCELLGSDLLRVRVQLVGRGLQLVGQQGESVKNAVKHKIRKHKAVICT